MISTALYFHVGYLDYMLVIEEVAENTHVDSCNAKAGQLLNIMMYNHYLPKCSIETATMYKYKKKKSFPKATLNILTCVHKIPFTSEFNHRSSGNSAILLEHQLH